jgi:hypothetical protein
MGNTGACLDDNRKDRRRKRSERYKQYKMTSGWPWSIFEGHGSDGSPGHFLFTCSPLSVSPSPLLLLFLYKHCFSQDPGLALLF